MNMKKEKGIFFTEDKKVLKYLIKDLVNDPKIISKKIFEPSCGKGDIILFLLKKLIKKYSPQEIINFIKNNLFFNDVLKNNITYTIENIQNLIKKELNYQIASTNFNAFCSDFTIKNNKVLSKLYSSMDYIIGNPPYITLYGRRSIYKTEKERKYFIENYKQFPKSLKNGKINYIMLFIEHGIEFLKDNGELLFIIDISFLDTPYKYLRQFLFKNFILKEFIYNISHFKDVYSGQLIIKIKKTTPKEDYSINFINFQTDETYKKTFNQSIFLNKNFEINYNKIDKVELIISEIDEQYKKIKTYFSQETKFIRTATMLLSYENEFIVPLDIDKNEIKYEKFLYYKGSKSLTYKFEKLKPVAYFVYDIDKQNFINEKLKIELEKKGIKNKKRIGLGDINVFKNPKLYIRQSAKEIITSIDLKSSASNNSLYILSFKDNSESSIEKLFFFNGWLNSTFITAFAIRKRIIKHGIGKQPQIRISDLYNLPLILNENVIKQISSMSKNVYHSKNEKEKKEILKEIDKYVFEQFNISQNIANLMYQIKI